MPTMSSSRRKYLEVLFAFLLYAFFETILFHPFVHNLRRTIFTPWLDSLQNIWFINWWPFAILHGINPFITLYVWYPTGANLTWSASIPFLSLIISPLTVLFSPILSWNILDLSAPILNALCAFLLFRYITKDFFASLIAGYIFGFSSYVVGQLLCHMNLNFVCLVPLSLLLFLKRYKGDIKRLYFILIMSLIISAEAGISTEILATATFFGFLSLLCFSLSSAGYRKVLLRPSLDLVFSYILACFWLFPFIYFLLKGLGDVPKIMSPPVLYSSDLLNYIIPTPVTMIGRDVVSNTAIRFSGGNYSEKGAYLGIILLFISAFSFRDYISKNKQAGYAILAMCMITFIFSLGPYLQVNGVNTNIRMPWIFFTFVPLIKHALPIRFTCYLSLIVALMISVWLAENANTNKLFRYTAVLFGIVLIIPNPNFYRWETPKTPRLFAQNNLLDKSSVMIFPFGYTGPSMYWQVASGMNFYMANGYVGWPSPLPYRNMNLASLCDGNINSNTANAIKSYCARFKVNYVAVCEGTPHSVANVIKGLGWESKSYGDSLLYSVPHEMFSNNISGWDCGLSIGEPFSELPDKRIAIDVLDGTVWFSRPIEFSSAGGLAEENPVGRFVTRTLKPLAVNKSFNPVDRMTIELFPVRGQPL